jgi:hypothetical protein
LPGNVAEQLGDGTHLRVDLNAERRTRNFELRGVLRICLDFDTLVRMSSFEIQCG